MGEGGGTRVLPRAQQGLKASARLLSDVGYCAVTTTWNSAPQASESSRQLPAQGRAAHGAHPVPYHPEGCHPGQGT